MSINIARAWRKHVANIRCRKHPLATPIRLCETAQRDDKKAAQERRADRAHGAETGEPQGTGGAPRPVPCYRFACHQSVAGLIAVDTPWTLSLSVPVVTVSGHNQVKGVTNIVLDHVRAAEVALKHLFQLGHRKIAFIKGQEFSSDTEVRWANIEKAARQLGLPISPALVSQLKGDSPSPHLGYEATRKLLASHKPFTALFAFNDISAMGAIRALREAKLRVPDDVSVVGFDDIQSAAYQNPALTTVRQPLREMGRIAAETLLRRIRRSASDSHGGETMVEPKLIIRETTCRAPNGLRPK